MSFNTWHTLARYTASAWLVASAIRSQEPALSCGSLRLAWAADGGVTIAGGADGVGSILRSGGLSWAVTFVDGSRVTAAQWAAAPWSGTVRSEQDGPRLVQHWRSSALVLRLEAIPVGEDALDLRLVVLHAAQAIQRIDFPQALPFDPAAVGQVVFPQHAAEGVGLALSGRFFGPHGDTSGGYAARPVGPQAYAELFGAPLRQLDDNEPDTALRVTEAGREWFDTATAALINAATVCVNRPSAPGQTPVVLVDSDSGPAVSASDLGGRGLLLRFGTKTGGADGERESRLQQAIVISATAALARRHPERFRGRVVAVVDLARGPEQGSWTATPVSQWIAAFRSSTALRGAGARLAVLSSPSELRAAWSDPQTALILNPYGEMLPTGAADRWREDMGALRAFVRGGGFWWEVGGYPFFYVYEPQPYLSVSATYPGCTADFVHVQGQSGSLALFGVHPLMREPWDREAAVTPAELSARGTAAGGLLGHAWFVHLLPGQVWTSPPLRLMADVDVQQGLAAYATAIGLRTPLSAKLKAPVLDLLKGAVLVRLGGATAAEQTQALERLPRGSLVHFTEYLKGGFDKEYPDHLPPRESWGTAADLTAFYARGRELGHLMMPYTNTSWWCIDPKGPTFEREGEAPLSRRRDGSFIRERYGSNEGYQVCFWHPAVQEAHRRTRRQMSAEFPSDVLFQDQVGARGWAWDFHPAAPSPTAWIDGLHSLGMEDAAHVPLATEDGHDRVVEFESMLCGMAWGVVPSRLREAQRLVHRLPAGEWGVFPMIQYLAHDKVLFALHDLGHFVLTDEQLAYVLGLGYSLSYRLAPADLERAEVSEWLAWLDAVQKTVCTRYAGQPLTAFALAGGAPGELGGPLMAASYPGLEVVANTSAARVSAGALGVGARWADAVGVDLAGHGFLARGERLWAGLVVERGQQGPASPFGFALEGDAAAGGSGVLRAVGGQTVILPWPGEGTPEVEVTGPDMAALRRTPSRRGPALVFALPGVADAVSGTAMPSALVGKPFAEWGPRRRTVAVLTMGGGAPSTWVKVSAADWLRILSDDQRLQAAGATVIAVDSAADLRGLLRAADAERPFAVVNPGGEYFYAEELASAEAMLDDIRGYVRTGGIWWETGGYSFYTAASRDAQGAWTTRPLHGSGSRRLGFACAGFAVADPPVPLRVTDVGRQWFGEAVAARIEATASGVQRGFEDDDGVVVLVDSAVGDFVGGIRCGGWGWLLRLGGFNPDPEVAALSVCGVLGHLLSEPWSEPERRAVPRLWRVRLAAP
jgi:hypothetical protein